ncbi:TetR/AcrR family transcriptional regulator [Saccharopolyspora hirsuta]|uniref:TetR/AcrR family transcriptional regulator n=1 Tax=Saccharopolyspora hirsuta TaxID=1837 RepID=A0A5M7BUY6_SACHI|nr:TetR/AcrR family transcriptional regulator [Saccharopolyspora hirsuta]KAA5832007.1 TetR/AcrR family transcriptional regulator [Saccharopolyspora hirsuta]
MPGSTRHTGRRADALTKQRIVEVAVAILDADGERGLNFRRLGRELRTGPGAIYHHVANKDELLSAATEVVLEPAVTAADSARGRDAVRTVALAVFDAIDAHPWAGTHLSLTPTHSALLRIFECIGGHVRTLGIPRSAEFASASALLNYILGVGGQNAANARLAPADSDRGDFLTATAASWADLDAERFPFTRDVADQLREHDDREQFLAGIDLILDGIRALGAKR